MNPQYHAKMIARILAENRFIAPLLGKCGSVEVFVSELADWLIARWMRNPHRKPPWQAGRRKTRGGRDQDRWRNVCLLRRFKQADEFWDSVPKLKLLPDDDHECLKKSMSCPLKLTITDNPDCDFVKGGE